MERDTASSWKPLGADLAIAAGTAVALVLLTAIAVEEGAATPDIGAYLLSALVGVALLWRRRYPVGVCVASLVLVFAYHALGYPAIGNLPLAVALMSASYYSATGAAAVVASTAIVGTFAWFLLGESRQLAEAINFVIRESGVLAAVILTGSVLRSRRQLAEETQEKLRLARADQEARASQRMAEERLEIAREIHDVVAHTVTVIGVQAKVAMEAFEEAPSEAEAALEIINDSTREATAELRATVGVLRSQPSLSPAPRLDQLHSLVDSVSTGDLTVDLTLLGEQRALSGLVELIAFRVVQEALTNVVRHAEATHAKVEVAFGSDDLRLTVSDNGIGGMPKEGYGIAGMRERLDAVGGTLSIERSDLGGLRVDATVPTTGGAR